MVLLRDCVEILQGELTFESRLQWEIHYLHIASEIFPHATYSLRQNQNTRYMLTMEVRAICINIFRRSVSMYWNAVCKLSNKYIYMNVDTHEILSQLKSSDVFLVAVSDCQIQLSISVLYYFSPKNNIKRDKFVDEKNHAIHSVYFSNFFSNYQHHWPSFR